MNERIKKLAEQAGCGYLYDYDADGHAMVCNVNDIEKFAELIVRECVTRLEQHHPFTKDPEAYLYAISLIEEHFGVE
jgi:hypothetical protein